MRKIKWGVLGTAMICERDTIPGMLLADNCELYAVAGRNPEKVGRFVEKYGFERGYDSYDALLADPQVEAVYIPLPNTMHHEWTIKALRAKKHVLCEKPMAPSAVLAQEMFDAARENGVLLMEAFAYQHSPYLSALKAELDRGTIGAVRYMECTFLTSDYNMSNIRMRRDSLGGALYDLGVYNNSLILRMLGEEPQRVQAIASFSGEHIDLLTSAMLEYADGKRACLTCGMILPTEQNHVLNRFTIQGEKGTIRSGSDFNFNGCGKLSYIVADLEGNELAVTVDVPHNYRLEVEQLGRCIAGGEVPAVTQEFTLANARIIDRILEAMGY